MKVYEALAEAFAAEGVTEIFGLMGDSNMYMLAAVAALGKTKIYDARHEGAALAMADGWSRVTGKTGMCTVTSGPGLTQLGTSLVVASRARTPLVVFTGNVADPNYFQAMDHRRFADGCEAGFVGTERVGEVYDTVRQAFYLARVQSRPVVLDVQRELQSASFDDDEPYRPSSTLWPEPQAVRPGPQPLERAAAMLASSRKPVIIVGRGAVAADAGEAVRRLAKRVGALIATTLLARGWLADDEFHAGISGLFATRHTTELFADADCVLGVGASLNDYTIESGYLYGDASFIHVDLQSTAVMGSGRIADCYLQGDARATLEALDDLLAQRGVRATGYRTPEVRAALDAEIDPTEFAIEPGTVDPRRASALLDEALPAEIGVVLGLGHFVSFPAMWMRRPRDMNLCTSQFGCIGQGLPTAMGAAIATGRPTVLIEGDASIMMQIQELDTIARYQLPLMMVVMNDEALGAEYHKLRAHQMDEGLARIASPNLGDVAKSFGCAGRLIRTLDDLRSAVDTFVHDPKPTVLDLRVTRNVPSVPYRRLHFGEVA